MAGDSVSPQEWKRRRKKLDEDTVRDEKRVRGSWDGDSAKKAWNDLSSDRAYKKAYGKELGYEKKKAKTDRKVSIKTGKGASGRTGKYVKPAAKKARRKVSAKR